MGRSKRQNKALGETPRPRSINAAPLVGASEPLVLSAETLRTQRRQKYNPLRRLTPEYLASVLDQFEYGYLREAVLLWEKIAERDDVLAGVKPKREKDVSQLDRQVTALDDSPEAQAHQEVLEDFWANVRCTDSYDRNVQGGFRRLVKQMMTSVSNKYSVHHIVWQPRADGKLRATFSFVPLWLFENQTGTLRYLRSSTDTNGEILESGSWMVTVGDGLMISCCIGYLAKNSAFNDWLIFSEKFSVPGVLGRTSGSKDSPEGQAMRAAVESFGHDFQACIYGDDGTHAKPLEIIQAEGNPSGMPMPAVIERVDRKFASLYRGADLSTMSSNAGEGAGASLQGDESDILRRDDAETIAETLEQVSRWVIEWTFGDGTEPLARVELVVADQSDESGLVTEALHLADRGAKVSMSSLMERRGIPIAQDDQDTLRSQTQDSQEERAQEANAFNPLQPRAPKGQSGGGRWIAGASTGKGRRAVRGEMRPGTEADRKRLRVAPAWNNLQVTDDPSADLLGTAKNAKGKTVYFYSEAYTKSQAAAKFGRIAALHKAMPDLQSRMDEDILSGGPNREQALALRLITLTGLRNGGDDGGGKVPTFGASNLLVSQTRVSGNKVHLDFVGKKGVRQRHTFEDLRLASHIESRRAAGATQVFDGDATKTLSYLKDISGNKFKVHDFRTWHGTMLADAAASRVASRVPRPRNAKEFKTFQNRVAKVVGRQLGNNPKMALKAYIHPQVFAPYEPIIEGQEAA